MKVYIYPACFRKTAGGSYSIDFPDLPGCVSAGASLEEAMAMARESLSLHLFGLLEDGEAIPDPSEPAAIYIEPGTALALVEGRPELVQEKLRNKAVKKTLTVPYWLNREAERARLNFSQILQEALRKRLGV